MTSRTRWVTVGVVVAVLVVAAIATGTDSDPAPTVSTMARIGAADAPTTWFCAEGSATPDGRADEEVLLGNVGIRRTRAFVSVHGGADVTPVMRPFTVLPGRVVRVRVSELAPIADPGVVVETTGGRAVVEHRISRAGETALGPCARQPIRETRFAAGTTARGAELWLALFNPYPDDAIVDVEALTDVGRRTPGALQGILVPRHTRLAVPIHESIPRVDTVATQVSVRRGRVVVEQSQHLDGSDGRRGLALSGGADAARTWRFPVGILGSGHQERLVLANPAAADMRVAISFGLDAAAAVEPVELTIPATSVTDADLRRVPPDVPFSIVVRAARPLVAEMVGASGAPQPADVSGLASDMGMAHGAREWAVIPGRLDARSTDVLAVMATDGRRHRARVLRVSASGVREVDEVQVPASGRALIDLDEVAGGFDVALLVRADGPVVVERESTRPGLTRSHAIPG